MEDMQAVSRRRMMDLERRVFALEERMRRALWPDEWMRTHSARENALVEQYGEAVDKTLAARILGVTRATVYAMLADGRITGACEADVWMCGASLDTCPARMKRRENRHAGKANREETEEKDMSVLEMVILLAFGIPIAVLSCAFVVLACRMQDREEKRLAAQRRAPLADAPAVWYHGQEKSSAHL